MTKTAPSEELKKILQDFFSKNKAPDLITTYLFYLEKKHKLSPVLFIKEKTIYKSEEDLISILDSQGKLSRKTNIRIQIGKPTINAKTKKVYICPFSGKVFGDNTHQNPLDAIYDWVSKCPENTERVGGLKSKRFFISEDPQLIASYLKEQKQTVEKTVFSSYITGKLFNSPEAVVEDLTKNFLKPMALSDAASQNRFQLEDDLLQFIQEYLEEGKISEFVEQASSIEEFTPYVSSWLEEEE